MPVLPAGPQIVRVSDIIKGAMRLLGAIAIGEEPSAAEMTDGLSAFNALVESWNTERLTVFTLTPEVFPLVSAKQTYTMGPQGDFNTFRPLRIEQASLRVTTGSGAPYDLPLDLINDDEWAAIAIKNLQSTYPRMIWNDGSFPQGNLNFWPVPTDANSVVLYTWQQIQRHVLANDPLGLPPGYERALKFALAIEISPEYKAPSAEVVQIAITSKANLMSLNAVTPNLSCDDAMMPQQTGYGHIGYYNPWLFGK